MSVHEVLTLETIDGAGVRYLKLARPQQHHALNTQSCHLLVAELSRAFNDHQVKTIVLKSQGPVFCAGADLKEMATSPHSLVEALIQLIQVFGQRNKPIMVELAGDVYGGGLILLGLADCIIAQEDCKLFLPELKAKVWPFLVTPILKPIWPGHLLNHILTLQPLTAKQAFSQGWFAAIYPENDITAHTKSMAQILVSHFCPAMVVGLKRYWQERFKALSYEKLTLLGQDLLDAARSNEDA